MNEAFKGAAVQIKHRVSYLTLRILKVKRSSALTSHLLGMCTLFMDNNNSGAGEKETPFNRVSNDSIEDISKQRKKVE